MQEHNNELEKMRRLTARHLKMSLSVFALGRPQLQYQRSYYTGSRFRKRRHVNKHTKMAGR